MLDIDIVGRGVDKDEGDMIAEISVQKRKTVVNLKEIGVTD